MGNFMFESPKGDRLDRGKWGSLASLATIVVAVLWLFVGVERIVGDHEAGISWQVFFKDRPSIQLTFDNSAQQGLELIRYEALTPAEQASFIGYCKVRFGTIDPAQCHAALLRRML